MKIGEPKKSQRQLIELILNNFVIFRIRLRFISRQAVEAIGGYGKPPYESIRCRARFYTRRIVYRRLWKAALQKSRCVGRISERAILFSAGLLKTTEHRWNPALQNHAPHCFRRLWKAALQNHATPCSSAALPRRTQVENRPTDSILFDHHPDRKGLLRGDVRLEGAGIR